MLLIPTPHNTPIHIFDIPLILDLICDHLTKDDLLPCLQVSHYWHDLFKPQFLRCVRFADLKEHQTWAILDNAARIRSLTIDIADAGWLLDNPYSPCINLQVLRCVDFGYVYPHDYNSYDDELDHDSDSTSLESNQVDLSTSALNLIQSNPKLAVLEVIHCRQRYRTSHFTPAILTSISKHQTLSQIKINLDFLLPDSFLVALLHHLPLSLEDLSFSAVGALKQSGIPADSPKPTLQGPTNLRRISLRPCDTWFGEAEEGDHDESYIQRVVLLLIQNSPGLVDLSLAGYSGQVLILLQTLADVCPLVETIDFDGYNCVNHEIMALTGFLSHLREFKFYGYYSAVNREQRALVPTFLRRSSATLQVISVIWEGDRHGDTTPVRSSAWHFWPECPHLREYIFELDTSYGRGGLDYQCLNVLVELLARPTVACWNLQKLEIWITDHPVSDDCARYRYNKTSQGISEHQQSFLQLIQPFYHCLRSFKKLRQHNLEIHWDVCSSIKKMCMDEVLLGINKLSALGNELQPALSTHSNSSIGATSTSMSENDSSSLPLRQPEILERDLKWMGINRFWYSGQELQLEAEEIAEETKLRSGRNRNDSNTNTPWARDYKRVGCGWRDWKSQAGLHGCSPNIGSIRSTNHPPGLMRGRPADCQCLQCLHEVPDGLDEGLDRFLSGEDVEVERGHRRRSLQRCRRKHIK